MPSAPSPSAGLPLPSIVEARLLTRETTFLSHSLNSVAQKYGSLLAALHQPPPATREDKEALADLVDDCSLSLQLYATEVGKAGLTQTSFASHAAGLRLSAADYTSRCAGVQSDIEGLRGTLDAEREVRREKEEYETLASVINEGVKGGGGGTGMLEEEIRRGKEEIKDVEEQVRVAVGRWWLGPFPVWNDGRTWVRYLTFPLPPNAEGGP